MRRGTGAGSPRRLLSCTGKARSPPATCPGPWRRNPRWRPWPFRRSETRCTPRTGCMWRGSRRRRSADAPGRGTQAGAPVAPAAGRTRSAKPSPALPPGRFCDSNRQRQSAFDTFFDARARRRDEAVSRWPLADSIEVRSCCLLSATGYRLVGLMRLRVNYRLHQSFDCVRFRHGVHGKPKLLGSLCRDGADARYFHLVGQP